MAKAPTYSQRDRDNAAADAKHLMQESRIVPKLVAMDLVARRLYLQARMALDSEIKGGWDIKNPELVLHVLGQSVEKNAVALPVTALELHQQVLTTVVPILEIFIQMEHDHAQLNSMPEDSADVGNTPQAENPDQQTVSASDSRGDSPPRPADQDGTP